MTYTQSLRVPQGRGYQTGPVNLNDSQVGCGIVADGSRGTLTPVVQGDFDPLGVMHHVAVGEDEPVRGKDKT